MEIWKGMIYAGDDYSEWIEVSNKGRIRNPKTGKIRKQNILQGGYYFVNFSMGSASRKKTVRVHKAVAENFIPNPEGKPMVNHIDGNKLNNSIDNLEWTTHSENMKHAHDTGLASALRGTDNPSAALTDKEVEYVRENFISGHYSNGARAMARMFGTTHATIMKVVRNESYI